jgi:general stress protein 13
VKVKVLSIDEAAGKIGLSIRATEEAPEQVQRAPKKPRNKRPAAVVQYQDDSAQGFNTLKDKLQEWIAQSDMAKK